jgi:hypothetical protein
MPRPCLLTWLPLALLLVESLPPMGSRAQAAFITGITMESTSPCQLYDASMAPSWSTCLADGHSEDLRLDRHREVLSLLGCNSLLTLGLVGRSRGAGSGSRSSNNSSGPQFGFLSRCEIPPPEPIMHLLEDRTSGLPFQQYRDIFHPPLA